MTVHGAGADAGEPQEQAHDDHEQRRSQGDHPEDRGAMRQADEEVPEQGQRPVVKLGAPRVRTQNAGAHDPDEQRDYDQSKQQRRPEQQKLAARARLGVELGASAGQRFQQGGHSSTANKSPACTGGAA